MPKTKDECIITKKGKLSPEAREMIKDFFETGGDEPLVIKPVADIEIKAIGAEE